MLTLLLGLVIGAVLGLVGLRLLAVWQARPFDKPNLGWPHRRH